MANMTDDEAVHLANTLLQNILQNQTGVVPASTFGGTDDRSANSAKQIAAFRSALIEALKKQP